MHQIIVNGLPIDVVRKDIKNLHLGVYPPDGRVRVAAPLRLDDEAVRLAVISRLGWIQRQQAKFQAQERETPREYVTGESHYFQGERYRLNVEERDGPSRVVVRNRQYIDLFVRPGSTTVYREKVMAAWYRASLHAAVPALIEKWEPAMGVQVAAWGIRQMKTRWGSCKTETGRITVNQELAKKSPHCLEFIVIHEMTHLLERKHSERFTALMTQFLPLWRLYREELNREPLGYAEWEY